MARRESRFLKQQKIALGFILVSIAVIAGYLFYATLAVSPGGDFVEGEHYQLVEEPRRIKSERIEVLEFFSYGCIHCYNLDSDLDDWVEDMGDTVDFLRVPAIANDYWRLLGRAYYTLEELDALDNHHIKFFRSIHDGRQVYNSPDSIISFFDDVPDFEKTFRSPEISAKLNRADQLARRLKIASVPTVVVQGKYLVQTTRSVGRLRMLEVMSHLVEKETAAPEG